jgi:hypothetical protein
MNHRTIPSWGFAFAIFCCLACQEIPDQSSVATHRHLEKTTDKTQQQENRPTENRDYQYGYDEVVEDYDDEENAPLEFPQSGLKPEDFLPSSGYHQIQYKASGDLNDDMLDDLVLVLDDGNRKRNRPILLLLRQADGSLLLDQVALDAMPSEYGEAWKRFSHEEVNIDGGKLRIEMYGMGPSGNQVMVYAYSDNLFVLERFDSSCNGAGGGTTEIYNADTGMIIITRTGFHGDEISSETDTIHVPGVVYPFATTAIPEFIKEAQEDSKF